MNTASDTVVRETLDELYNRTMRAVQECEFQAIRAMSEHRTYIPAFTFVLDELYRTLQGEFLFGMTYRSSASLGAGLRIFMRVLGIMNEWKETAEVLKDKGMAMNTLSIANYERIREDLQKAFKIF